MTPQLAFLHSAILARELGSAHYTSTIITAFHAKYNVVLENKFIRNQGAFVHLFVAACTLHFHHSIILTLRLLCVPATKLMAGRAAGDVAKSGGSRLVERQAAMCDGVEKQLTQQEVIAWVSQNVKKLELPATVSKEEAKKVSECLDKLIISTKSDKMKKQLERLRGDLQAARMARAGTLP